MGITMDSVKWGRKLAADHEAKTGLSRRIRLPSPNQIRFDGDVSRVTVTMEETAVCDNLQTNSAAFEGWSLALKIWCEVEAVELRWKSPAKDCTDNKRCHYQRFLYRVERFRSLFPNWFYIPESELLADAEALGTGHFCLNSPKGRPTDSSTNGKVEHDLENYLVSSDGFKEHFGLQKLDRQLPVGLFRNSV